MKTMRPDESRNPLESKMRCTAGNTIEVNGGLPEKCQPLGELGMV